MKSGGVNPKVAGRASTAGRESKNGENKGLDDGIWISYDMLIDYVDEYLTIKQAEHSEYIPC